MSPTLKRFGKYSSIGLGTFLFDLLLLYLLTDVLSVHYLAAAGIAFLVAVTINYFLSRTYVFKGTARELKEGYVNFLLIVLVGLAMVTGGMYVLVNQLEVSYLVARICVAAVTGFWNYSMNLFLNFKVAGKH